VIVVADTSPLNYLVLIGQVELLPALYDRVLLPAEVHRELIRERSPAGVREWAGDLPSWCEVRDVSTHADEALSDLDRGEREAILLALESGVDTVLMDELEGRREAMRRNLRVTGTLGILEKAAQRGWIDFHDALRRLDMTNFRLSSELRHRFLNRPS